MCGIIGYAGKKIAADVLIMGLKKLEYRGYDSAGLCLSNDTESKIIKCVGRVSKLEDKLNKQIKFYANRGIAHTRWATNGEANLKNSHPHRVGKVTLVHNGIIENADIIKNELINLGYKFNSDTDSEVIAALLDNNLKNDDVISSINNLGNILIGSYALVIMIEGDNNLYALRKDSPLVIGFSNNESFVASDITAISNYVNKYAFLEFGEIAVLNQEGIIIYKDNKIIKINYIDNVLDNVDMSKNGYAHYMLKEIMEEPKVIKNLIDEYKNDSSLYDISSYNDVRIVACGSAMYAGMISKYLIEEYANIRVEVIPASEYRYQKNIFSDKNHSLIIFISQSGETADTIAALRESKKLGIKTLGIVNNPNSTIFRECDSVILTNGGVEIAVATTKAYLLQVCVLSLIALTTGINKNIIDKKVLDKFKMVPNILVNILNRSDEYRSVASILNKIDDCFFIGRGLDYAISMEGSLKLKEVSYIHSEAYPAGELKHGTISLIEKNSIVFTIISDNYLKDKTLSNLKECEARGAKGIIIRTDNINLSEEYTNICVPYVDKFITPLLIVPTLQLIAYYVALDRKCDIDKPRNLAKSVTVE